MFRDDPYNTCYVWCAESYVGFVSYAAGPFGFYRVDYPDSRVAYALASGCLEDAFFDPLIDYLIELNQPWATVLHDYATTAVRVVEPQ